MRVFILFNACSSHKFLYFGGTIHDLAHIVCYALGINTNISILPLVQLSILKDDSPYRLLSLFVLLPIFISLLLFSIGVIINAGILLEQLYLILFFVPILTVTE